jgi:hypothetical protein
MSVLLLHLANRGGDPVVENTIKKMNCLLEELVQLHEKRGYPKKVGAPRTRVLRPQKVPAVRNRVGPDLDKNGRLEFS